MRGTRFSREQIIAILKDAKAGVKLAELSRKYGVSEATIYNWKAKYGDMTVSGVGSRYWECQQKFRIRFGPMGFSDYQRMLPKGESICRLIAWVRNYVGDEMSWDLQLILTAKEVPRISLGKEGQLGWSTWLGSREFEKDMDNLVLGNRVLGSVYADAAFGHI